jgi:hypothetical protein
MEVARVLLDRGASVNEATQVRKALGSHLLACFAWFSSCNMIGLNDELPEAWIVWNQSLTVICI